MAPRLRFRPWYVRELTGRRLVWNFLFYGGHAGIFAYGWHKQATDPRLAVLNQLEYSVWISRGAGIALAVDGFLLILPGLRNVVAHLRPKLAFALPLDENIWFHRQIAYSLLFWTIVHTTAHYVNMINVERTQVRIEAAWQIMYTQPAGITGHVMLLIMFLMYTTAHAKIRHQCFEAFWYRILAPQSAGVSLTGVSLQAFFFFLGLYTHATGCFVRGGLPGEPTQCLGYGSWRWTVVGGILYFSERIWREIRARRTTHVVGVVLHCSGTIEIRFLKPSMKYKAGMWLFLNVPDVSTFQWHPFTISSAPDDPYISVHIRQVGDFTKALGERLGCTSRVNAETFGSFRSEKGDSDGDSIDISATVVARGGMPLIRIDGPYGSPAEDVCQHEVAVLVGAGIGVTPYASIVKDICHMQNNSQSDGQRRLQKIELCLINRDSAGLDWFQDTLKTLEDAQTDPDFLHVHIYLTGNIDPATEDIRPTHDIEEDCVVVDAFTPDPLSRTQAGRPDWRLIFAKLRTSIESGSYISGRDKSVTTDVGVYACCPSALARTIKEAAREASSDAVKFTFKKEHF